MSFGRDHHHHAEALLRVHSKDLHEHVAQEVGECLESGLYTDLMIRCKDGQTLHGHRLVLSAVSPFLKWVLEQSDVEEFQTLEIPDATVDEMNLLLEVIYNGSVDATIEDLRALILLAHRLYISIPMSDELMEGLDLTLPSIPPFRPPPGRIRLAEVSSLLPPPLTKRPSQTSSAAAGSGGHSSTASTPPKKPSNPLMKNRPQPSLASQSPTTFSNGGEAMVVTPNLPAFKKLDPNLMTAVLSNSQNSEHICPICNSKYNNVGNFKLHMKNHDNEQLREQRNALLSEMIANSFNPQSNLYTCHVCNSNYNHSGNFKQHLLKHERESGSISATLVAQAGHNAHLTNVLQSAITDRVDRGDAESDDKRKQYKCEHCLRTFKHPGNFKQHLASHMRSATIAQDAVDLNSSAPPVLSTLSSAPSKKRSHSHGSSTPAAASAAKAVKLESEVQLPQSPVPPQQLQLLACPECHLEFPGVEALQGHIAVNHKHLDVEMPGDLQKTFTDRAKSVLQQQQSFICELCNQGFKTEAFLYQHKMSFHKDEMLAGGKKNLKNLVLSLGHQATVIGSDGMSFRSFTCTICGKSFPKMNKLTQHMKIHGNPEEHYKHPCDVCGKKFTRPQHVIRHKLLHTGDRPFSGMLNSDSNDHSPGHINTDGEDSSSNSDNGWVIEHDNGEEDEEEGMSENNDDDVNEVPVARAGMAGETADEFEESSLGGTIGAEPIYSNPNSDEDEEENDGGDDDDDEANEGKDSVVNREDDDEGDEDEDDDEDDGGVNGS